MDQETFLEAILLIPVGEEPSKTRIEPLVSFPQNVENSKHAGAFFTYNLWVLTLSSIKFLGFAVV